MGSEEERGKLKIRVGGGHHCNSRLFAAVAYVFRRWYVSLGAIIVATVAWWIFEYSGLAPLTICSDVLLILIVLSFLCSKYCVFRNKSYSIPELNLSEQMVNSVASSFLVDVNEMLLTAHNITLGKEFMLFFKILFCIWLLSVAGNYLSGVTIAYIGIVLYITVAWLYCKYQAWQGETDHWKSA